MVTPITPRRQQHLASLEQAFEQPRPLRGPCDQRTDSMLLLRDAVTAQSQRALTMARRAGLEIPHDHR